jgi:PilZ domain
VTIHDLPIDRERRASRRARTIAEHGIARARVRPGREATVLDVSSGGIFLETLHRLLPGTTIDLQLTLADRCTSIRGRVLRSAVACLRFGRVLYCGAIAFERPLAPFPGIDGYAVPPAAASDLRHGREDATPPTL